MKIKLPNSTTLGWILLSLVVLGTGGFLYYRSRHLTAKVSDLVISDPYQAFTDEIYMLIQTNLWQKISDQQLSQIYLAAANKLTGKNFALNSTDVSGVNMLITAAETNVTADQQENFVTQLNNLVLQNLPPLGRSQLYTAQLVQNLNNEVNNIDTSANLYANLGVDKNAPQAQIDQSYHQQASQLSQSNKPADKQKLAQINRAYQALGNTTTRQTYNQSSAEPAVPYKQMDAGNFYIKLDRFTPTIADDFKQSLSAAASSSWGLILDLRGNIGGDIDLLPNLLGEIIGAQSNAFGFIHQSQTLPQSSTGTRLPIMNQFQKIIILTDNQTQSSAEILAAALKTAKVGVVVGTSTRGWGSIERVFDLQHQIDLNQKFSVLLVHTLTLADDGQPIEGRGVKPDIDIGDKSWLDNLQKYTDAGNLATNVQTVLNGKLVY